MTSDVEAQLDELAGRMDVQIVANNQVLRQLSDFELGRRMRTAAIPVSELL